MITDKELLKLVKYKLGIFDLSQDIPEGALDRVTELIISNESVAGKPLNVDLTQLSELKNLTSLDLNRFRLEGESLDTINSLPILKKLAIRNSILDGDITQDNLEKFSLERGELGKDASLPEAKVMNFNEVENVELGKIKNDKGKIRHISIRGGNIRNPGLLESYESLETLIVVGTKVDDEIIKRLTQRNVGIVYMPEERNMTTTMLR